VVLHPGAALLRRRVLFHGDLPFEQR
jgi:hypothetical protein